MKAKLYFVLSLCALFGVLSVAQADSSLPAPPASMDSPPLEALLQAAELHNPRLEVARERINVSDSRIDQVSALPDPQLSFNLLNLPVDSLSTADTPMSGTDFKLSQKFPFPGKLSTKKELAQQQKLWAQAKYDDLLLQVRQQIRDNWYKLNFQRQAIALTETHVGLMDDFSRLVEMRYQVGKGMQQNVLKAQVERSRLFDSLLVLQEKAEITQAQLNSLAGRSTALPIAEIPATEVRSGSPRLESLQALARQNRPMFLAFDALIGQNQQQEKLAKLDYRPDFNLWAGYRLRNNDLPDGGTDFVSGGITINLPFPVAKRRAAVAQAAAGLRMAQQQRNDFARQVDFELHRSLTQLKQAQKLVELYGGGIVPQAEQAYKATLAAYQVDKVDFLSLADSLMTLYRFRIDYARAQSDVERANARIQAITGLDKPLPLSAPQTDKDAPHA